MCKYYSISAHFLNIAHFLYGSDVRLYDSPGFKLFILVGWAGASYPLLGPLRFTTFLLTFLLLSKDQASIFYLLLLQLALCRVSAVKSLPVIHP